jgi:hypothetical protein
VFVIQLLLGCIFQACLQASQHSGREDGVACVEPIEEAFECGGLDVLEGDYGLACWLSVGGVDGGEEPRFAT